MMEGVALLTLLMALLNLIGKLLLKLLACSSCDHIRHPDLCWVWQCRKAKSKVRLEPCMRSWPEHCASC